MEDIVERVGRCACNCFRPLYLEPDMVDCGLFCLVVPVF